MLAAEKQVLQDQAKSEGNKGKPKPANIIDKIIFGRINKVNSLHAGMKYPVCIAWQCNCDICIVTKLLIISNWPSCHVAFELF